MIINSLKITAPSPKYLYQASTLWTSPFFFLGNSFLHHHSNSSWILPKYSQPWTCLNFHRLLSPHVIPHVIASLLDQLSFCGSPSYLFLGVGNGHLSQYSCLGNSMDQGSWWATAHGVPKSRTRLRMHSHTPLSNSFIFSSTTPLIWEEKKRTQLWLNPISASS